MLCAGCGGQTGNSVENERPRQVSKSESVADAGTSEDAIQAPNGTFAQYFGEPDAVSTGCGVAGSSDQHFADCSIYELNGYTQVDVGLWSLDPDARSANVAYFWAWNVVPWPENSTQPVGPVWAGVAQAPNGDTIVAGTFGGGLEVNEIAHPEGTVGSFLARISPDGMSEETVPLGGAPGEVALTSVSAAADGTVLVAGRYSGAQTFGVISGSSSEPHPFLMQLSGTFTPSALTDFAAPGEVGQIESVAPFPDGSVLVGGARGPEGAPVQPFLARVDSEGTVIWERSFPGLEGRITHVTSEGDAWYASLDATGTFTWGARDVELDAGSGALIAGSGESDLWAQSSQVPLTALVAGQGRLVAIGAADHDVAFGDAQVQLPLGEPSIFLLGLEPSSGAERWSRVYTSAQTPFAFNQASMLPSARLLVSGQERVPTDFGLGWEPDDQGTPVGLWLALSPLP